MNTVIFLSVLSTLPQFVVPQFSHETSFRAIVEMVSADSRIFSGETVQLKCSIPDVHGFTWDYLWFRGSEQLPQSAEKLTLWKTKVQESGKHYCQGVRDTRIGKIHTLQSLPLEINVDGGWAILHVPPYPRFVGETLTVTCRIRVRSQVHEMILYKDGVEVIRHNALNPHFYLANLTLEDQGMYSCRASWDTNRRTHSVISADVSVQVLEVLSQPFLEIVPDDKLISLNKMKLVCHLQYNTRAPAPPIHFYFYKNGNRLGTAKSENHDLVRQTPGQYSCKAKVSDLGISRTSEPKSFGHVTGPEVSSPDLFLFPAAEPAAARPSQTQSSATPTFLHPAGVSIQSSYTTQKPSLSAPSILLSTVQSLNNITMESGGMFEESSDMSEESSDMSEESGDMSEESGDMSDESGGISDESGGISDESGGISDESGGISDESSDIP